MEGEIMPLPRPCSRCGDRFKPTGKFQRYCDECMKILMSAGKKKRWKKK